MLRVVYLIYTLLICQSFAFVRMSRTVKRVAPAFDEVTEDVLGQSPGQLPGVSSRLNFCKAAVNLKYDWWIVGTGTLGVEILKQLRIPETGISVIAETHEEAREKVISDLGATHMLRKDRLESDHETARNVVICIPPSAANYTEEVHAATMLWAGPASGGSLIYTSSIGVYGESHGNTVDEEFRVDTRSASATKLLAAEEAVLSRGGNVLRLAGLYTATRGPHAYWLHKTRDAVTAGAPAPVMPGAADALVNMLHYEDAAGAVIALIAKPEFREKVFLACDNDPVSKQEICRSALASGLYPGCPHPQFAEEQPSTGGGKICNSARTRALLQWQPTHSSFRVFMRRLGGERLPDVATAQKRTEGA